MGRPGRPAVAGGGVDEPGGREARPWATGRGGRTRAASNIRVRAAIALPDPAPPPGPAAGRPRFKAAAASLLAQQAATPQRAARTAEPFPGPRGPLRRRCLGRAGRGSATRPSRALRPRS